MRSSMSTRAKVMLALSILSHAHTPLGSWSSAMHLPHRTRLVSFACGAEQACTSALTLCTGAAGHGFMNEGEDIKGDVLGRGKAHGMCKTTSCIDVEGACIGISSHPSASCMVLCCTQKTDVHGSCRHDADR